MLSLGELEVDTHVLGIEPAAAVKILHVKRAGDAADVTYELLNGLVLTKTLFAADAGKLELAP